MRTVDVLLRGFNDCEHAQFRAWSGVMNRACSQYMIYHEDHLLFYVRDPRFGNVKPYIHFCAPVESKSELRLVNAFLSGIGCVNKFKLVGNRMEACRKRKIEPKYLISWISKLQ